MQGSPCLHPTSFFQVKLSLRRQTLVFLDDPFKKGLIRCNLIGLFGSYVDWRPIIHVTGVQQAPSFYQRIEDLKLPVHEGIWLGLHLQ